MNVKMNATQPYGAMLQTFKTVGRDISDGIVAVTHNALALIGFGVLLAALLLLGRPDTRQSAEQQALSWLQSRLVSVGTASAEPAAPELVLPAGTPGLVLQTQMDDLPKQQRLVAEWLSRRYRIAPDPMAHMVSAAYETAAALKLDPLLVLSVVAIESSFNPFVQSGVGAQGLMQVMSNLHEEKFERFGGTNAAFDPVTSIKVGTVILKSYVSQAGSVEGGLKMYVGAANFDNDGGYGNRVLVERARLVDVAAGKRVPVFNPPTTIASSAVPVSHAQQSHEDQPMIESPTPLERAPALPVIELRDVAPLPEGKPISAGAEIS